MARPQREPTATMVAGVGATSESLELLRPREFVGAPGSGAPQAQPFHLEVHTLVPALDPPPPPPPPPPSRTRLLRSGGGCWHCRKENRRCEAAAGAQGLALTSLQLAGVEGGKAGAPPFNLAKVYRA